MVDMTSHSRRHEREAWYLVQFRPNCFSLAHRNLTRQGFEVFCPRIAETRKSRGQFRSVRQPLFPGYLFVHFNPSETGWRSIKGTRGVSQLVSFAGVPEPVPSTLIDGLRLRCDDESVLLPEADIGPGDRVRVTAGPFAEFVCTIDSTPKDQRVWVLLEIMGREARVALPARIMQRTV